MLEQLKEEVCRANRELPESNLVVGTSGNVSGRDEEPGLIVIKPSGVKLRDLTPDDMSVVNLDGEQVAGDRKPSVDTASHCYVYRHRPDVNGIVHTHSRYATAFAVRGEYIPCISTLAADIFGGRIPVSDYAAIGTDEIGKQIIKYLGNSSAVLLRSHGVFTIGKDCNQALRSATYVEEIAEVAHLALQLGSLDELDDQVIAESRAWYLKEYGQTPVKDGA